MLVDSNSTDAREKVMALSYSLGSISFGQNVVAKLAYLDVPIQWFKYCTSMLRTKCIRSQTCSGLTM